MGLVASTASATSINQILQQQTSVCTNTVTQSQTNNCPPMVIYKCNGFTALCENLSSIRNFCQMDQMSSMAQQAMTHAGAMAQGGAWGITVSASSAVSQNLVQNFMTQMCSNKITSSQNITTGSITCKESDKVYLTYINKFTSSNACIMTQFAKTSQSAAATSSAAAKGYDPFADLAIIGAVLVLGIIGVVLVFATKKGNNSTTTFQAAAPTPAKK